MPLNVFVLSVCACPQEDLPQLEQLGASLLAVWRRHISSSRGGRMCTPLLLTADLLLSRTALRDLQPPASAFPEQLLELVREEAKGCTDVPRLHAAAGVLCQLAGLEEPVRSGALRSALIMLANRYPKVGWAATYSCLRCLAKHQILLGRCSTASLALIYPLPNQSTYPPTCTLRHTPQFPYWLQVRRYAAEQLYTMLLTFEPAADCSQDVEAAMELISATAWDGPLAAVRPARAQVFRLFGLPEPVALPAAAAAAEGSGRGGGQQNGGPAAAAAAGVDENASYQALLTHNLRGL